jgi:hypothetical protein
MNPETSRSAVISRRLLAPAAIQDAHNNVVSIDLGSVVRRLILFDTYILQSVWLEDLRLLTVTFGDDGLTELMNAGALGVYCESFTVGETGRVRADLNFRDNNQRLPLGSYSFSVLRVQNPEQKIQRALERFSPNLRQATASRLLAIDPKEFTKQVFDGFYGDLRQDSEIVSRAVSLELRRLGIKPKGLSVCIEQVGPEDFRVNHNLETIYGLSEKKSHDVVCRGLLAIAGLNQRIAEMLTHSSLSGVNDEDLPLLEGKMRLIVRLAGHEAETKYQRVIGLAGLPNPSFGRMRIDAQKLLKLRDSDECRAFRDWLAGTPDLSDHEIVERLRSVRARIAEFFGSTAGRLTRFIVAGGLSYIPHVGLALGPTVSAVDMFLLEKLAPKDSIVSFLSNSYPNLFQDRK